MVFRGVYRFFQGARRFLPGVCLLAATVLLLGSGLAPTPCSAAPESPWWHLEAIARPGSSSAAAGEAEIALTAINLGDAPAGGPNGPISLTDTLPQGVTALDVSGVAGPALAEAGEVDCVLQTVRSVSCAFDGSLVPYDEIEIRIRVELTSGGAWTTEENRMAVTGGGAPPAALERKLLGPAVPDQLGIEEFELRPEEEGGAVAIRAGSHPFQVTAAFSLAQTADALPTALPKDLRLRFPPGLVADVGSVPACPLARFHEGSCSAASAVGVGTFAVNDPTLLGVTRVAEPIFNLEPALGEPARFGSLPLGLPVIINSSILADDYSVELTIGNISQVAGFLGATVTLWGVPGNPRHDDSRGLECLMAAQRVGTSCLRLEDPDPRAMLTMPTSCNDPPLQSSIEVAPWVDSLRPVVANQAFPQITGCENVPFQASAEAVASSVSAASPSGFELRLVAPGSGLRNPTGIGESALQKVEVTLPEGVTINPAAATGLSSCGERAYELESSRSDGGCPDASKVGTVTIEGPLFAGPLTGSAYLGGEEGARFDGSVDLYLVARNPSRGILVKLRAELRLDPRSGRVTVVADQLPQLPLSSLRLNFPPGPRALLATPPRCGTSAVENVLTPYSVPGASVRTFSPLTISRGSEGGPCPGRDLPFHPRLEAGTLNNAAARYSPLYVRISRSDSESGLAGVSLVLPPGLSARIAGVATCSSDAIVAAAARTGAAEAAAPSCPSAAAVGRSLVSAGVGPVPTDVPGRLYLAGPDDGAPLSLAAVTPALVGPLDLGTIVRRFPLRVDLRTGQLRVEAQGNQRLPSMIDGFALHLRDLRLYFDRTAFTLNPSSCEPMAIRGLAYGSEGEVAPLAERFQAAGCRGLRFRPSASLRLSGALGRNGHPALHATIRPGAQRTSIAAAGFTLPPGELLDFHNVDDLCSRQLAPRRCPIAARLGYVRLSSPLLADPLRGPVYLREPSHGLPDLLADLRSEQVQIVLRGSVTAPRGRLRVRFGGIPDLPLSRADVVLPGGKAQGIIVNSESLCGRRLHVAAALNAHNGRARGLRLPLDLSGC